MLLLSRSILLGLIAYNISVSLLNETQIRNESGSVYKLGFSDFVDVDEASLDVANLIRDLDHPKSIVTLSNSFQQSDMDCPLSICDHITAIVMAPDQPRLFIACLENRRFCGLCPSGASIEFDDHTFRCDHSHEDNMQNNDCPVQELCDHDFHQRLRVSMINNTDRFVICSKHRSFCGFCPSDMAVFNGSTVTCDELFPETKIHCNESASKAEALPDQLSICSPLVYICLPGKKHGIAMRCPNPKMRYNLWHGTCAFPEHVPECGGHLDSKGRSSSEIDLPFNVTELEIARSRGSDNECFRRCLWYGHSKGRCIRMCY